MGTNYYHRTDICDRCNRYKEKHIGKSSGGWQFSFQGHDAEQNQLAIRSFEDWKKEFQKEDSDGQIFTEYGEEISFEDFVKMVEDKQTGEFNGRANINHYDNCMKTKDEYGYDMSQDWKDKEGYSFSSCHFS